MTAVIVGGPYEDCTSIFQFFNGETPMYDHGRGNTLYSMLEQMDQEEERLFDMNFIPQIIRQVTTWESQSPYAKRPDENMEQYTARSMVDMDVSYDDMADLELELDALLMNA